MRETLAAQRFLAFSEIGRRFRGAHRSSKKALYFQRTVVPQRLNLLALGDNLGDNLGVVR
jgi:hypothetical protein